MTITRSIELTDPDGDAITITEDQHGTYVTATTETDEVTVGPFPPAQLRTAVPAPGPTPQLLEALAVTLCAPHRAEQVWRLLSEIERDEHRAAAHRAFTLIQEQNR